MNWKRPLNFTDSALSMEALLDNSFQAFKLPVDHAGDRLRASDYLPRLQTEKLVDLDEQLRSYYHPTFQHWPRTYPEAARQRALSPQGRHNPRSQIP